MRRMGVTHKGNEAKAVVTMTLRGVFLCTYRKNLRLNYNSNDESES